jgi:hypothetical protein
MVPRFVLGLSISVFCFSLVVAYPGEGVVSSVQDWGAKLDEAVLKGIVKGEEVKTCVLQLGLEDCAKANILSERAKTWVEEYKNSGSWTQESTYDGKADAFRHCVWNALMTLVIGRDEAKTIADNHEAFTLKNDPASKIMDLANNESGRVFGEKCHTQLEAKVLCYNAAIAGKLRTLKP